MDIAQLGIRVTSDGMSQAQSGLDGLTRSGASAESQMQRLGSTSSGVAGQVAILTAALASAYAAYKTLDAAIGYGMRVETLGVAMNVVAKNAGVSSEAIQYFSKEVKAAGVTSTEAFSVITKAMVQGIDLNKMKDLATRARDIAVVAGQNTSDTLATIMHGIESGMPRIFHTLGIAVRDQKTIFDEYATSVGKTGKELNQVEKATATLNEVMRASAGYAGAAAAADETVGKQLATLDRVVKDTYESFWTLFGPGMSAGVQELTKAFKDLQGWAKENEIELHQLGVSVGDFVKQAGEAGIATGKWLLENKELTTSLAELYICVKVGAWVAGLAERLYVAAGAAGSLAGIISGSLVPALIVLEGAAGVLGVIQSFQGKGDTGQGIGKPGTATMGEDMWEYANQAEDKGYDLFAKKRTQHMEGIISGGQSWSKKIAGSLDLESYAAAGLNRGEAVAAAERARLNSAGGKGGGGKGAEGAEASVRKFIETMAQETAKGAGDTEAILTAWKNKKLQTLEELAAKGADITKAKEALNEAATSKQMKLDSDFNDWYIAGMGNQYEALVKQENKKLTEVTNNEVKTSQVHEVYARKKAELDDQVNSNTMALFKGYLDTMAGLNPTLEGQLTLKRQALDLELKISDAALERQIWEKKINSELADEARHMAGMVAQAKKFGLEMQNDKGLSGWAYGRVKADSQKNTWADAMGGLEDFVGNAWTQGIQGALSKTKVDYMEVAKTMAQSFILNLGKQGITWGFGQIAKGILGDKATTLGTVGNPMWVTFKGMGLPGLGKGSEGSFEHTVQKAGKIGYSTGGGGQGGDIWNFTDMYKKEKTFDKAFDADMKGWITGTKNLDKASNAYSDSMDDIIKQNQDAFKTEYITGYENSFTGMAGNITSVWGTAQGLMTAAGVQGESQRYATMAQYGIQGITLLYDIAAKGTLAKAWTAGASAYSSVWEFLGFPLAVAVAPVMAAIAFAGTLAAGSKSSAGGDYQVGMTGPRLVHQDETILPAWAAQSWRDIVSQGAMPGNGDNSGGVVVHVQMDNHFNTELTQAQCNRSAKQLAKAIDREIGRRGRKL